MDQSAWRPSTPSETHMILRAIANVNSADRYHFHSIILTETDGAIDIVSDVEGDYVSPCDTYATAKQGDESLETLLLDTRVYIKIANQWVYRGSMPTNGVMEPRSSGNSAIAGWGSLDIGASAKFTLTEDQLINEAVTWRFLVSETDTRRHTPVEGRLLFLCIDPETEHLCLVEEITAQSSTTRVTRRLILSKLNDPTIALPTPS